MPTNASTKSLTGVVSSLARSSTSGRSLLCVCIIDPLSRRTGLIHCVTCCAQNPDVKAPHGRWALIADCAEKGQRKPLATRSPMMQSVVGAVQRTVSFVISRSPSQSGESNSDASVSPSDGIGTPTSTSTPESPSPRSTGRILQSLARSVNKLTKSHKKTGRSVKKTERNLEREMAATEKERTYQAAERGAAAQERADQRAERKAAKEARDAAVGERMAAAAERMAAAAERVRQAAAQDQLLNTAEQAAAGVARVEEGVTRVAVSVEELKAKLEVLPGAVVALVHEAAMELTTRTALLGDKSAHDWLQEDLPPDPTFPQQQQKQPLTQPLPKQQPAKSLPAPKRPPPSKPPPKPPPPSKRSPGTARRRISDLILMLSNEDHEKWSDRLACVGQPLVDAIASGASKGQLDAMLRKLADSVCSCLKAKEKQVASPPPPPPPRLSLPESRPPLDSASRLLIVMRVPLSGGLRHARDARLARRRAWKPPQTAHLRGHRARRGAGRRQRHELPQPARGGQERSRRARRLGGVRRRLAHDRLQGHQAGPPRVRTARRAAHACPSIPCSLVARPLSLTPCYLLVRSTLTCAGILLANRFCQNAELAVPPDPNIKRTLEILLGRPAAEPREQAKLALCELAKHNPAQALKVIEKLEYDREQWFHGDALRVAIGLPPKPKPA